MERCNSDQLNTFFITKGYLYVLQKWLHYYRAEILTIFDHIVTSFMHSEISWPLWSLSFKKKSRCSLSMFCATILDWLFCCSAVFNSFPWTFIWTPSFKPSRSATSLNTPKETLKHRYYVVIKKSICISIFCAEVFTIYICIWKKVNFCSMNII